MWQENDQPMINTWQDKYVDFPVSGPRFSWNYPQRFLKTSTINQPQLKPPAMGSLILPFLLPSLVGSQGSFFLDVPRAPRVHHDSFTSQTIRIHSPTRLDPAIRSKNTLHRLETPGGPKSCGGTLWKLVVVGHGSKVWCVDFQHGIWNIWDCAKWGIDPNEKYLGT